MLTPVCWRYELRWTTHLGQGFRLSATFIWDFETEPFSMPIVKHGWFMPPFMWSTLTSAYVLNMARVKRGSLRCYSDCGCVNENYVWFRSRTVVSRRIFRQCGVLESSKPRHYGTILIFAILIFDSFFFLSHSYAYRIQRAGSDIWR